MPPQLHVWNGERAHIGRWRELDGIAVVAPPPGAVTPSTAFIEHCCRTLAEQGYTHVVTPTLTPGELLPFLQSGFQTREQLHVLVHDLRDIDTPAPLDGVEFRRARTTDIPETLEVDGVAFDAFWRFDREALVEACNATPQFRFRVAVAQRDLRDRTGAVHPAGRVVAYCITGRSRQQGFLQRLAVLPGLQSFGLGRALVGDALSWLAKRRSRTCIVNTQESNDRAARLYRACGFRPSPAGLYVLIRPLTPDMAR